MIHLTYSNRTEALLGALVRRLRAQRASGDPLAPVHLVVPNRNVERYVELGVARRLGIAANLRFTRLGGLLKGWLGEDLLFEDALLARTLRALHDPGLLAEAPMAPVRRYLEGAGPGDPASVRAAQLALHLARLLEEYGYSRPELLRRWSAGGAGFEGTPQARTEAWQAALWRWMRGELPAARTLEEALAQAPAPPPVLHVFGLSYVARGFAAVFGRLGADADLFLYTLNPCEEFWEDLETASELRRRRRRSDAEPEWLFEDEDPFALSVDSETPLLRSWGRPGREHVRLLGALTDCDFEAAFVDPLPDEPAVDEAPASVDAPALPLFASLRTPSLLARLQSDILHRRPRAAPPPDARRDESVQVLACPSLRREVEAVAAQIWRALDQLDGLTFDRIAVLVNGPDRALYLPHVSAVFERAQGIPYNVTDLALASVSPLVEASLAVLELAATPCRRPDVLAVITHPCVRRAAGEVDAEHWASLTDRLGVFRGLDAAAHAGTYVEGEELLHWEQGLTRVTLGAFLDDDAEPFAIGGARYLPEPPRGDGAVEAAYVRLVRSLLADVRRAREAALPLADWARLFGAMVRVYVHPADEREEAALRRVLGAALSLAALDLDGHPVRYPAALELVRERVGELAGSKGQHLAGGVAVSSLLPMRAIPFRAVFVLGMGEGRFPATDRRDSMDLRAARRQAGDVTPSERDRYTFLETLLCARERLVLSYVARDERTGDPLAPSTVVTELLEVIEAGYLADARARIERPVPLRRAEAEDLAEVLPEAERERRAQALGASLRAALGPDAPALAVRGPGRLSRRVDRDPRLREVLGLRSLPEPELGARGEPRTIRLPLSALRRFLECPMQGWTRAVLRLDEDVPDGAAAAAEEPLTPTRLDETIVLRGAFAEAALAGGEGALEPAYRAAVERLQARGRWPLGPLEDHHARAHLEALGRWWARWAALGPAQTVGRARLGAARQRDASEELHDPLVLGFDDPKTGHPRRVELVGRTELLRRVDGERASVSALVRRPIGEAGRVHALRVGLRGFFDHVALSALGEEAPHEARQLYADVEGGREVTLRFDALPAADARAWLTALLRDLLGRSHAYLLPVEAVLRFADRFDEARGPALLDSIARVRDRWGGGQSAHGPVSEPLRYPPPPLGEAEEMVARRFGPLFAALREVRR